MKENKMFDFYIYLVLNRFCKLDFVTKSIKRGEWYERAIKPEVGYVLKLISLNRSYQNTCLLTRHQDVAPVRAFSLSILAANRCAITRTSANRETLYTDECFMNHGTVDLCKVLLETGKWLKLAIGSRYECLINRIASLSGQQYWVDRGYGCNVGASSTFTWFTVPTNKGLI